jgi:E1A/CREB-binding protein
VLDENRMRLTEQERLERQQQLQKTLELLVHSCNCNNPSCSSSSCRRLRQLFAHAVSCEVKVTGGCTVCKKMWCLLNLHAKSCTSSDCAVPRCR